MRFNDSNYKELSGCLNPYCNGRYSMRYVVLIIAKDARVLILIVMEDTL